MEDVLRLTDREEIEDLVGNPITDDQWMEVKVKLSRDKHMWQAIDEAIGAIADWLSE